jgi:hypothetical protein
MKYDDGDDDDDLSETSLKTKHQEIMTCSSIL